MHDDEVGTERVHLTFPSTGARATDCVVNTIRTGHNLLERVQAVCQRHGLTLSTANILAIIEGAGEPLPAHIISARLVITSGAVTQFLDVLEKRGLIQRIPNPNDRRSILVEITDKGRQLRAGLGPELSEHDQQWMAGLTPDEQTTLLLLLEKLQGHLTNLEKRMSSPPE